MKQLIGLSLLLGAVGCSSSAGPNNNLPTIIDNNSPEEVAIQTTYTSYTLVVPSSFTGEEQKDIAYAVKMWEADVPVHFNIVAEGDCAANGVICLSRQLNTLYLSLADSGAEGLGQSTSSDGNGEQIGQAWGTDNGNPANGNAAIVMYKAATELGDFNWTITVAHELGHAMGLVHHSGCFLMNPGMQDCMTGITVNDVDQWWNERTPLQ